MSGTKIEINNTNTLTGLAFISELLVDKKQSLIDDILTGGFTTEHYFRLAHYHVMNKEFPANQDVLYDDEMDKFIVSVRYFAFQANIENKRKAEADNFKQRNALKRSMEQRNKPSEMGTVKEIAQKYNVSLKKVRQLKKENRLHELTETQNH